MIFKLVGQGYNKAERFVSHPKIGFRSILSGYDCASTETTRNRPGKKFSPKSMHVISSLKGYYKILQKIDQI